MEDQVGAFTVRSLEPGDEHALEILATDAADFGLSDDGRRLTALDAQQAALYVRDPSVVHWVALYGDELVGSLVTIVLPLPVSPGSELLLYEIGVRASRRRQGVGSALIRQMDDWMAIRAIETVWVLADDEEAQEFYGSCGFESQHPSPAYMLRSTRRVAQPARQTDV